jgi:hypothetical protein
LPWLHSYLDSFATELNLTEVEKTDFILIKNEIRVLNLNANKKIFVETSEPFIFDVKEIVSKQVNSTLVLIDIKTKTREGKSSVFVEGFQAIKNFRLN